MIEILENKLTEYYKAKNKFIEDVLKTCVEPPIKGEITKGKLTWRGIRYNEQPSTNSFWITQRGEQVGPKFIIEIKY